MSEPQALIVVGMLGAAYPHVNISTDTSEVYVKALMECPHGFSAGRAAAMTWAKQHPHFPRLSELLEATRAAAQTSAASKGDRGLPSGGGRCRWCAGTGWVESTERDPGSVEPCECRPEQRRAWASGAYRPKVAPRAADVAAGASGVADLRSTLARLRSEHRR